MVHILNLFLQRHLRLAVYLVDWSPWWAFHRPTILYFANYLPNLVSLYCSDAHWIFWISSCYWLISHFTVEPCPCPLPVGLLVFVFLGSVILRSSTSSLHLVSGGAWGNSFSPWSALAIRWPVLSRPRAIVSFAASLAVAAYSGVFIVDIHTILSKVPIIRRCLDAVSIICWLIVGSFFAHIWLGW